MDATPQLDGIDQVLADHAALEALFQRLEEPGRSPQERQDLVREVITRLVAHSEAEEVHLYPLVARRLDGGERMAEVEREDHGHVERLLVELEASDPGQVDFDPLLRRVLTEVRSHVQEEEAALLPALRERCTPEELAELGERIRATERVAPTHPHPSAPDHPPLNAVLGPLTGLVDRTRDALRGR